MLSIVRRGEHRYDIFENDRDIGSVSVSRSPLHDRHCQLHLELERYDPEIAGELFRLLRRELGMPLKVMKAVMNSLVSEGVLFIFQLPAMTVLRYFLFIVGFLLTLS